jgi:cysteinyl-tRNA synthetase
MSDLHALSIRTEGTRFPRATEHIAEQIALIEKLEKNGHTYRTSDGVYFDTSTFDRYGALGNIDIAGLEAGARVDMKEKRNPTDFALWKFSPANETRLQEWPSPWGKGFPGWHIECSAMSMKYLGETLDIHTGGIDHIPVHHNNEIAQSECATGTTYANTWIHNAFASWEGAKMSKSLGNVLTLSDLKDKGIDAHSLKLLYLQSHYRSPIALSMESIIAAGHALKKIYTAAHIAMHNLCNAYADEHASENASAEVQRILASVNTHTSDIFSKYKQIMSDDLNTSSLISTLFEDIKSASHVYDADRARTILSSLLAADALLGLGIEAHCVPPHAEALELSKKRDAARASKDYAQSDAMRDSLKKLGYDCLDGSQSIVVPSHLLA